MVPSVITRVSVARFSGSTVLGSQFDANLWLSKLSRDALNMSHENLPLGRLPTARWVVNALCGSWGLIQLVNWATRARNKLTTAIRTLSIQNGIDAGNAECAFERANSSFLRLRRKVFIAALAVWAYFKHFLFLQLSENECRRRTNGNRHNCFTASSMEGSVSSSIAFFFVRTHPSSKAGFKHTLTRCVV